jgi:hydrogenase maturation protease
MRIKLVGLGHDLRGDDQIGLKIIDQWIKAHAEDYSEDQLEVEALESPGLNLLGAIAGLDTAVLVDAVQSGAPARTRPAANR